jgi:hypothetical protein
MEMNLTWWRVLKNGTMCVCVWIWMVVHFKISSLINVTGRCKWIANMNEIAFHIDIFLYVCVVLVCMLERWLACVCGWVLCSDICICVFKYDMKCDLIIIWLDVDFRHLFILPLRMVIWKWWSYSFREE